MYQGNGDVTVVGRVSYIAPEYRRLYIKPHHHTSTTTPHYCTVLHRSVVRARTCAPHHRQHHCAVTTKHGALVEDRLQKEKSDQTSDEGTQLSSTILSNYQSLHRIFQTKVLPLQQHSPKRHYPYTIRTDYRTVLSRSPTCGFP